VKPERLVLVGTAVINFDVPSVPRGSLVIHGEQDTTVPLAAVLDWARPQDLPLVVVPGAEHFFHRRLHLLRDIVESYCR
jgi:alpha/beta superfamily hydrolase